MHSSRKLSLLIASLLLVLGLIVWLGRVPAKAPEAEPGAEPGGEVAERQLPQHHAPAVGVAVVSQATADPTAAWVEAVRLVVFDADKNRLHERLAPLLADLNPGNLHALLAMLETLPEDLMPGPVWREMMAVWAQFDGAGAFDYAVSHDAARNSVETAMRTWYSMVPEAVISHLGAEPNADMKRLYTRMLTGAWLSENREKAMAQAESLADPTMRGAAFEQVTRNWVRDTQNPDFVGAATWLGPRAGNPESERAVAVLVATWAAPEPDAAARWVESLPAGRNRRQATQELIGQWASVNGPAAGEWLATQKPGPDIDLGIAEYSKVYGFDDPEGAMAWTQQITDPEVRARTQAEIFDGWASRDPEAASRSRWAPASK